MNLASNQFAATRRMGIYEPLHPFGMWGDFTEFPDTILPVEGKPDDQLHDPSNGFLGSSNGYEHEATPASKPPEKVLRRLAQNRQAARKSRLRKKAYVQQLENCKLRLFQLEQELERAKQQDQCRVQGLLDPTQIIVSSTVNSGNNNNAFELEYGQWVEEQDRKTVELRNALLSQVGDAELSVLVDGVMMHYFELFRMKATAAKADVFYVMNGMWKTSVERLFMWIGGFRPSTILKILLPHIEAEPMTEEQNMQVCNLCQSCQQAEDALSQGMEKLHEITAETVASGRLGEANYLPQIKSAVEKLEALVRFVNQADHLRQETLKQMYRILTMRQAARALLLLGEYLQRLRTMTSAWSDRCRETAQL